MTLSEVKDIIKTLPPKADHYYVGKMPNKKPKSIGIYDLPDRVSSEPIGGEAQRGYEAFKVSLLVHWNNNAAETETAAQALFTALRSYQNGGAYVFMRCNHSIDVSTDDDGTFERVIECEFIKNL